MFPVFCATMIRGSVAEWLKAHDSKSCGQQCLGGSNPLASANQIGVSDASQGANASARNKKKLPPALCRGFTVFVDEISDWLSGQIEWYDQKV